MISPAKVKYANILSAIAPALDTQDQPDYRYLASDPRQPKRNYRSHSITSPPSGLGF